MTLQVQIDEDFIFRFLARHLLSQRCYESLATLLLETNISLFDKATEASRFLQLLTLQGRWDDLLSYMKPILELYPTISKQLLFLIYKQRFLETMSWKGSNQERWIFPPWKPSSSHSEEGKDTYVDLNDILLQLNELKPFCTTQQFNSICMFLELENLEQHPEYQHWSYCEGRVNLFLTLQQFLSNSNIDTTSLFDVSSQKDSMQWLWSAALSSLPWDTYASLHSQNGNAVSIHSEKQVQIHDLKDFIGECSMKPLPLKVDFSPSAKVGFNSIRSSVPPAQPARTPDISIDINPQPSEALTQEATKQWPSNESKYPPPPRLYPSEDRPTSAPRIPAIAATASSNNLPIPLSVERERAKPVSWTVDLGGGPGGEGKGPKKESDQSVHPKRRVTSHQPRPEQYNESDNSTPSQDPETLQLPAKSRGGRPQSSRPTTSSGDSRLPDQPGSQRPPSAASSSHSVGSYQKKFLLFQTDCPIRSVVEMQCGDEFHGEEATIAVGTNSRSISVLRFSQPPHNSAASESTALVDYCGSVSIDRTMENCHKGSIYSLDWSARGALASASNDKLVKLWRLESTSATSSPAAAVLKGHTGTVRAVKFSPFPSSGDVLASCGAGDFRPRLWDVESGSCQRLFSPHTDTVHAICWLNTTTFLTGCEAGTILVHDLRSSSVAASFSLRDALPTTASRSICCMSSSLDPSAPVASWEEALLVVGCNEGFVSLLQYNSIIMDRQIHSDDIRSVELFNHRISRREQPTAFSSATTHDFELITSSYDTTSAYWRLQSSGERVGTALENLEKLQGGHYEKNLSAIVLKQHQNIVTTGADGRVVLWTRR